MIFEPNHDCCTHFATSRAPSTPLTLLIPLSFNSKWPSEDPRVEDMFRRQAYFDIDYLKVYVPAGSKIPDQSGVKRPLVGRQHMAGPGAARCCTELRNVFSHRLDKTQGVHLRRSKSASLKSPLSSVPGASKTRRKGAFSGCSKGLPAPRRAVEWGRAMARPPPTKSKTAILGLRPARRLRLRGNSCFSSASRGGFSWFSACFYQSFRLFFLDFSRFFKVFLGVSRPRLLENGLSPRERDQNEAPSSAFDEASPFRGRTGVGGLRCSLKTLA